MNYPLLSEYLEAIRSAENNFDKLSNLRPVLDAYGQPVITSGNFAVVFKMKDIETGKLYAVKCFTREQEERKERYKAIIETLKDYKTPYIVSTQYLDKELFVDTTQSDETEFPVVAMDWVEGVCLDAYLNQIKEDKFKRELLATEFQKLVCWLLTEPFAHGDLKPDNIIVKEDGSIVLVDYDGMYVPALEGKPALEKGTQFFQYKGRTLSDFNEYIDDYAAVLILLILKVNAISAVDFENCLTDNSGDFIRQFEAYLNEKSIAPLLSAYIMVSTFGRIDRQQIYCLLSDNSEFNPKKELELLTAAQNGDTIAMIMLGDLYRNGVYVPKNYSKAIQWYELAQRLGNVNATCGLCKCYFYGDDFCCEKTKLLDCLERHKIEFAYCRKGRSYYVGEGVEEDYKKAVFWYRKAAELGNPWAQNSLGVCYEYGNGVEKNLDEAMAWYQKAAYKGLSRAQNNLGRYYKEGISVEKDLDKAVDWYQKAAEAGNSDAQNNLGDCYCSGRGVKKDYKKAVFWYQKAAEAGNSEAQYNLGFFYEDTVVEQDDKKAVFWYQKAAENGNSNALYILGLLYERMKDCKQAVYWYRKAAEAGDSYAQIDLGDCYHNGKGVEKDYKKAVYWYQKAAEAGNLEAQRILGRCYYKGEGVEKDYKKAVSWLQKAAEAGSSKAKHDLGVCYEYGMGVEQDYKKAVFWLQKAAEAGNLFAAIDLDRLLIEIEENDSYSI